MTTRPMRESDIPAINRLYADSHYCFDWPKWPDPQYEDVMVVVDENDRIIMLCAALKRVELYLLADTRHPLLKLEALTLLHSEVRRNLEQKGFKKAFAYVQPDIDRPYGRRLTRDFGWERKDEPMYILRGV